jgi:hypothetical protein
LEDLTTTISSNPSTATSTMAKEKKERSGIIRGLNKGHVSFALSDPKAISQTYQFTMPCHAIPPSTRSSRIERHNLFPLQPP